MARLRRSYGPEVGDTVTDLGLVKVDRTGLPAATFTDTRPALGDVAVVLRSPLGLSGSAVLRGFTPGRSVTLTLTRSGSTLTRVVTLAER